ncbi:hypothetical protein IWZ03DRAFT_411108 [Phyllosticta citriasiana]|uniref:SsDNA binding protein n=1 Tax=Phyllosticta citriasiana TaxID=595635 RepID=A0ABR1KZS2_9PEZI
MFTLRRSAAILSAPARSFSSSARAQKASMTLVGRVARDPELKTTSRGEEFITYSIACKDGSRVDSGVSFYNISKFSLSPALKDLMMDLTKGTLVHVTSDVTHQKKEGESAPRLSLRQRDLDILVKHRSRPNDQVQEGEEHRGEYQQ